jgi:hypothetical protein
MEHNHFSRPNSADHRSTQAPTWARSAALVFTVRRAAAIPAGATSEADGLDDAWAEVGAGRCTSTTCGDTGKHVNKDQAAHERFSAPGTMMPAWARLDAGRGHLSARHDPRRNVSDRARWRALADDDRQADGEGRGDDDDGAAGRIGPGVIVTSFVAPFVASTPVRVPSTGVPANRRSLVTRVEPMDSKPDDPCLQSAPPAGPSSFCVAVRLQAGSGMPAVGHPDIFRGRVDGWLPSWLPADRTNEPTLKGTEQARADGDTSRPTSPAGAHRPDLARPDGGRGAKDPSSVTEGRTVWRIRLRSSRRPRRTLAKPSGPSSAHEPSQVRIPGTARALDHTARMQV